MRRPIVPAPLSLHLRPAAATWAASRDCHEHDRRSAREIDFAMTAPLKTVEASTVVAVMRETGQRAKSAARALARAVMSTQGHRTVPQTRLRLATRPAMR